MIYRFAVHHLQKVENQIKSGQRRREESVLCEVFNAHAVGHSIPPQSIKTALSEAGADIFVVEELLRCDPSAVDYNDFKRAALSPSPLEMWAGSIPLASILADALPMSSGQDPLRRISVLSAEEIACVAEGVGAALKQVLASKVKSLRLAYENLGEQTGNQTRGSKFQVLRCHCLRFPMSPLPFHKACSCISQTSLFLSAVTPLVFSLPCLERKGRK